MTFKPHIYTNAQRKFTGSADLLTRRSGESHVQRQSNARKGKMETVKSRGLIQRPKTQGSVLLPSESNRPNEIQENGIESIPYGPNSEIDISRFVGKYPEEELNGDELEELAIEALERERREWRQERLRLMHCIHHQQIELAQRASAAHERATEIAKEFSRVIDTYEDRLLLVENNVQQEIKGMKSIIDSLKSSVVAIESGQSLTNLEQRMFSVEKTMHDILNRLDSIAVKIK